MLSEISQTEKEKYCIVSLTFGVYKKSQTHRNREQENSYHEQGTGVREGLGK